MRILSSIDSLTTYQFHTHTAKHYFCKVCGIYPLHSKRVTPDQYGVNIFCLEGFDPSVVAVRATGGRGMEWSYENQRGEKSISRVTEIGGIFIKAKDPVAAKDWYKQHFGIEGNK